MPNTIFPSLKTFNIWKFWDKLYSPLPAMMISARNDLPPYAKHKLLRCM